MLMIPRNADVYDSDAVTDDELLSKLFSQTELDSVRNFLLGLKMFFFCFRTESNSVWKIL